MPVVYISITQADIDIGQDIGRPINNRTESCPIYRAAKRVLPNVRHVSNKRIVLKPEKLDDIPQEIDLPYYVREFIHRADIQRSIKLGLLSPTGKDEPDAVPLKPFAFQVQYFT